MLAVCLVTFISYYLIHHDLMKNDDDEIAHQCKEDALQSAVN